MPIISGKNVQVLTASSAYRLGYLTAGECLSTIKYESAEISSGRYLPYCVFVNGRYVGVWRENEKLCDMYVRLVIV